MDVFVRNTSDTHHSDRFNGQDYEFPPGEKVLLTQDAARHMFGFGNPDKSEALIRQGWANKIDPVTKKWVENEEGIKMLAAFVFTQGVMVEVPADEKALAKAAA